MPLPFLGCTGTDFSLPTGIWQPCATASVSLSLGLSFAAYATAQVTLALVKNNRVLNAVSLTCGTSPTALNTTMSDSCVAMQRRDNAGVLMFDSNGNPIYDSASLDRYQLLLTTSAILHIYGLASLSWFSGKTIASVA